MLILNRDAEADMNGMRAKSQRKKLRQRFTEKGLPVDANDWTEDDWRDLHSAIDGVISKIARRHAVGRCKVCGWPLAASAKDGCVEGNCAERPVK